MNMSYHLLLCVNLATHMHTNTSGLGAVTNEQPNELNEILVDNTILKGLVCRVIIKF